jgi:hypothetical protein
MHLDRKRIGAIQVIEESVKLVRLSCISALGIVEASAQRVCAVLRAIRRPDALEAPRLSNCRGIR